MMWVVLLGAAFVGVATVIAILWPRVVRTRAERDAEKTRRVSVEREMASVQRVALRLHEEHQLLTHFLNEFPHMMRELHSGASARRIPSVLLHVAQRALEPKEALVLMRRRSGPTDESPLGLLVVAAMAPEDLVKPGTEVPIGEGEIGFAAEVQRTMSRADFDAQTASTRTRLRQQGLHGFEPHLVAPMVFDEETVGVIALGQLKQESTHGKAVLRLIAQIGGIAIHDVNAYTQMKVTADVDGLTLVYNKRHMTQALAEAAFEAQQQGKSLAIFLFDLDHFKNYNDVNGHVAGDELLRQLARLVRENTRRENVFGRVGGEEFLLILKDATTAQALHAAENLRALIAAHPFPFAEKQPLGCVSVSGGVAEFPKDAQDSNALMRAADATLYRAKRLGRNLVLAAAPRYLREEGPKDGEQ